MATLEGVDDAHAVIAGDLPASELVAALEVVATALLEVLSPADRGAWVLERFGWLAAARAAEQGGGLG